jgi:hypothetical protein
MFPDNPEVQEIIASDFSRIFGWTGLLAFPVRDEYNFPGGVRYTKKLSFKEYKHDTNLMNITKEEYEQRYKQELERCESENQRYERGMEKYSEEMKRNLPHRTFEIKSAKEMIAERGYY